MTRTKLFAIVPLALFRRAVVLETPDGPMIAWQKEDVKAALDCMQQNHVAILGGHVLKTAEDEFYFTGIDHLDAEGCYVLDVADEEAFHVRTWLPKHFPEALIHSAYSLNAIGIAEVVWMYEEVITAIYCYANLKSVGFMTSQVTEGEWFRASFRAISYI
jgi:hypothetical protein